MLTGAKLVYSVAFSPDGKLLACSTSEHHVQVRDVASGALVSQLEKDDDRILGKGLAFSPDGKLLATSSCYYFVRLWNTRTWKSVRTMAYLKRPVDYPGDKQADCIAFSPDGNVIAAALNGGLARLWNARTGEEIIAVYAAACSIAFSRDERFMASGNRGDRGGEGDGSVYLWKWASWRELRDSKPRGRSQPPVTLHAWHGLATFSSVAFSPSGRLLAATCEATVHIFDTKTYDTVAEFIVPGYFVNCVAFSPDGRFLAYGSSEEEVYVRDVQL